MVIFDYESHIAIGILSGFGLDYFLLDFNLLELISFYFFIIVGSVLPDMDTPKSLLGCRIRPLSDLMLKSFGHRTLTHSILIITVTFFIITIIWGINTIIAGLTIGAVIHVLGDMLYGKVACLYPLNKKKIGFLK